MSGEAVPASDLPDSAPQTSGGGDVPDSDLPTDYTTAGQQAKTVGEGIARGATLGLSDLAETAPEPQPGTLADAAWNILPGLGAAKHLIGQVAPQDIAGRMQANPVESTVGQVAGGAGAILATGGIGGIASEGAGAGIARGAATKLAIATAARGAEGALFGGSNAVTDYALGDPNLNAQKIMSDVGWGSAINIGLGPAGKALETVFPETTAALNRAMGKLKDGFDRVVDMAPGDWGNRFRAGYEGVIPKQAVSKLTDNIQGVMDSHDRAVENMYQKMLPEVRSTMLANTPVEAVQEPAFTLYGGLESDMNKMRGDPDTFSKSHIKGANDVISTLQNDLVGAKTSDEVHQAVWTARKNLDTQINWGDASSIVAQKNASAALQDMRTRMGEFLKDPGVWGEDFANHFSSIDNAYSASRQAAKDFKGRFATQFQGKLQADPAKIGTYLKGINDPDYNLRNEAFNNFLNSAQNVSRISENYAGFNAAQGSISDRVSQLAKEHDELRELASALKKPASAGPGLLRESMIGAGLKTLGVSNPVVAGVVGGIEAFRAIQNPYEFGSTINNTFKTMKVLGKITQKSSDLIGSGIKAIFSGSGRGAIESGAILTHGYDQRVKRIQELQENPQAMLDHLNDSTSAIYNSAPNISQGIHNTMLMGAQFLASKIPQPQSKFPLSEEFEPSPAQKDVFNQYYDTVDNPMGTLESVRNGEFNNRQLEALQAVYPHLLSEMQTRIVGSLDPEKTKDMPYDVKISLAKFLGMPLDGNMTMPALMSNQVAFQPPLPPGSQGQKGPKSTLGGLKDLDVGKRAQTQTQTLEEEENT